MQQAQVLLPVQYKLSDCYLIWQNTIHRKWITCFTDPAATRPITFLSPKKDTFQNWLNEQQEPNNQNSSPEFPESWKDQESRYLSCNTKCQEWKCRTQSNTNGRRRKKSSPRIKEKDQKLLQCWAMHPVPHWRRMRPPVTSNEKQQDREGTKRNNAKKCSMLR